jgi:hypothetical protein
MDAAEERAHIHDLWNRVCYRLDVYALVITQCANVLVLIMWLSVDDEPWVTVQQHKCMKQIFENFYIFE